MSYRQSSIILSNSKLIGTISVLKLHLLRSLVLFFCIDIKANTFMFWEEESATKILMFCKPTLSKILTRILKKYNVGGEVLSCLHLAVPVSLTGKQLKIVKLP